MKKIRLVQKFGGNTALESVSFDGWWVVGGVLFFVHTPVQSCPYTRATRAKPSLRSEIFAVLQMSVIGKCYWIITTRNDNPRSGSPRAQRRNVKTDVL